MVSEIWAFELRGKATGVIPGIPVPGGTRRSRGPEITAPARGSAGTVSSLAATGGWEPPERRRRADIPASNFRNPGMPISLEIPREIGRRVQLPGNPPGYPSSRGIPREVGLPWETPWQFPGESPGKCIRRRILRDLGFGGRLPGILTGGSQGNRLPHPVYWGISRGPESGKFHVAFILVPVAKEYASYAYWCATHKYMRRETN